ncbi:MAG TPA: GAF domain-containing protein, partial [Candidatus Polarisedimenticolaceae bacterium]|nr:GAF domain-containing protein [Candidatus Polarisedimenticolaceae bacterium]
AERVRIWVLDRSRGYRYAGVWPEDDEVPEDVPGDVAKAVAFGAPSANPAEPPFRSRLTVPLLAGLRPLGAIELLESERAAGPFKAGDVKGLAELVQAVDVALEAVRRAALKERGHLAAITRLTRLFDLGRSMASALEVDDVVRVVVNRLRGSFDVENVYLWLADDGATQLAVAGAAGRDTEAVAEWTLPVGEGLAGLVAASGEAALFDDPEELPGLPERPDAAAGFEIRSAAAAPIVAEDGRLLGVIEALNREDETAGELDDGDLAVLRDVAESTAIALANARRFDAERRVGDLSALLKTAQDLGSHLDAMKVAFTLVHEAASVIAYTRAAVGLARGTRLELAAVSGQTFVDETLSEMRTLAAVLRWAIGLDEGIYVVQDEDGEIDADRPETREKFQAYFAASGMRSFLVVPLRDEEGVIGVFTLESTTPYAFASRDIEAATLLGVQAAVAMRNALLYERIPMVRMFRPLAERRERWRQLPAARRLALLGIPAAVLALLVLVPVPLRIGGQARVLPERRLPVSAEVEGRIARVLVREG